MQWLFNFSPARLSTWNPDTYQTMYSIAPLRNFINISHGTIPNQTANLNSRWCMQSSMSLDTQSKIGVILNFSLSHSIHQQIQLIIFKTYEGPNPSHHVCCDLSLVQPANISVLKCCIELLIGFISTSVSI